MQKAPGSTWQTEIKGQPQSCLQTAQSSTNNQSYNINKISVFGKRKYCLVTDPKDRQVKQYLLNTIVDVNESDKVFHTQKAPGYSTRQAEIKRQSQSYLSTAQSSTNNSSYNINKVSVFRKKKYCIHGPKYRQVKHYYPEKIAVTLNIGSCQK